MNNFAASPVNSTFDLGFVQHEPGAVCSTLMDKPFSQNLDECQRYYSKSPSYSALATAANNALGAVTLVVPASQSPYGYVPYKKTMAKVASYAVYSPITGLINNVRDLTSNVDRVVSGAVNGGDSGFGGLLYPQLIPPPRFTNSTTPQTPDGNLWARHLNRRIGRHASVQSLLVLSPHNYFAPPSHNHGRG